MGIVFLIVISAIWLGCVIALIRIPLVNLREKVADRDEIIDRMGKQIEEQNKMLLPFRRDGLAPPVQRDEAETVIKLRARRLNDPLP